MVYAQHRICPGEWNAQTPLGFGDKSGSPNICKTTWPCKIVIIIVMADHRVKLKESEQKDKYLDQSRKLKKLLNVKVTVISVVTGALNAVIKGLVHGQKEFEMSGQVKIIKTTALLISAKILRRVLRSWRDSSSWRNSLSVGLRNELKSTTAALQEGWFWHQITQENWYPINHKKKTNRIILFHFTEF